MRHGWILTATMAGVALAAAPLEAQPAAGEPAPMLRASVGYGTVLGVVRDARGAGLEGVLVSALGATSAVAVTDATGHFTFYSLPPGAYLLRAHLTGFVASERELIQVRPNTRLVQTFALRRLDDPQLLTAGLGAAGAQPGTAPPASDDNDHSDSATAWWLRHLPRSVLRDSNGVDMGGSAGEPGSTNPWTPGAWLGWAVESSVRLASALNDMPFSGELNLLTSSSFDAPQDLFSLNRLPRGVAYFSIGAPAGRGQWDVSAGLTGGEVASWTLAGSYSGRLFARHHVDFGMSYGAQEFEKNSPRTIAALADHNRNVGAVHGSDAWSVAPHVELTYGARYARYDYIDGEPLFSPEIGVSVSPLARTYVRAVAAQRLVAPGEEEFLPPAAAGLWLPPERTFASLTGDDFRAERVRHFEVAVEREFGETCVLAMRRFHQQSDDQLVTVFGLDGPGTTDDYYVGNAGAVDADGWGVRVSGPFARLLRGSVDYSLTRARWTRSSETIIVGAPAASGGSPEVESIHDVTTSVEAAIPETATRILVVYKLNSAFARGDGTAIVPGLDGRFDVRVRQALPVRLVRSEWEMLLAVRNLFREPETGASIYDELLVVRPPKRIVGGFLVRF